MMINYTDPVLLTVYDRTIIADVMKVKEAISRLEIMPDGYLEGFKAHLIDLKRDLGEDSEDARAREILEAFLWAVNNIQQEEDQ